MWKCELCDSIQGPASVSHLKRNSGCKECRVNPNWRGYQEITGVFLGSYKQGALKRGLCWEVTPEDLWSKWIEQEGKCAYTGWSLTHGVDASLDRKDNNVGYTLDNVQWVHRDVNRLKSDWSHVRFLELVRGIAEFSRGSF